MRDIDKAKAIAKKVKHQFHDSPEGRLMFSVFECAITDAYKPVGKKEGAQIKIDRRSGLKYLSEDMPHCELAGVSSEWVRRLIGQAGLRI